MLVSMLDGQSGSILEKAATATWVYVHEDNHKIFAKSGLFVAIVMPI
jgi:hypothetical protein